MARRYQVMAAPSGRRFAGLPWHLRALALTALRGVAGRITVGRPTGLATASRGSASGLK